MPITPHNIGSATIETIMGMSLDDLIKMTPAEFEAYIKPAIEAVPQIAQRSVKQMGSAKQITVVDLSGESGGSRRSSGTSKTKSKTSSTFSQFMSNKELKPVAQNLELLQELNRELGEEPSEAEVKLGEAMRKKQASEPKKPVTIQL